jgi:probable phosphoglycerate mutase
MTDDAQRDRQARPSVFDEAFLTGAPDVTEVLLIRHGEQVTHPPEAPRSDHRDPVLSERGEQQARLLGEALSTTTIDAIYASPLRRAHETAKALAAHHRIEPVVINDLREVEVFRDIPDDRAASELLTPELMRAVRRRMLDELSWDVYPYSESSFELKKRVVNAIESCVVAHSAERIAIVCHGGVINAYLGHVIGSKYDFFFRPAHTSIQIVDVARGRKSLRKLNDTQHLETAEGSFVSF